MGIKIGAYLILGTLNVLLLVLVGYIASTEPGIFRFQDVVFLGIAFIAVFLEMFTTYRIIKLLNKRISEPAHKLKIALEEYYRSGEMAINAEEYPREYEQPVELINRLINTVENFKIQNKGIKERENETIVGLEKELRIQKEATLKVLQEIDEEKEVSQANAQELKKFQLAVEEASDHILITDSEGLILYTNPAGEQLTGYTIDEMIGSHAGMSWGEKVNEDEYRELWDILKGGKRMFAGEITNMRKDGSTYVAQLTITPIFDEDDPSKVIFFVSIQRDITKAKEIDRMKTEFISLAS
ncbi:MAG: PAS domain S-box protein, partial [Romboutsia sp.]|nr:PAS domain S-box protein [Romboutsia sp.]